MRAQTPLVTIPALPADWGTSSDSRPNVLKVRAIHLNVIDKLISPYDLLNFGFKPRTVRAPLLLANTMHYDQLSI